LKTFPSVPSFFSPPVITNTRFPIGDSGSSLQLHFALKLIF